MSELQGFSPLLDDLPRGRHADDVGSIESAYFEHPDNLAAAPSLQIDPKNNPESKIFLGVVNANVQVGKRLADGRYPRWAEGGVPIGVADDRHHFLLAGSRGGKGRSVLAPNLLSLPKATSVLVLDPKGDLAALTAKWRNGERWDLGKMSPSPILSIAPVHPRVRTGRRLMLLTLSPAVRQMS